MLDPRLLFVCISQVPNNPSKYVVRAYKKPFLEAKGYIVPNTIERPGRPTYN